MRIAFIALILGVLVGAGATWLWMKPGTPKDPVHSEEHEHENEQRTVWTDRFEVFLEHPLLVAGEPATFVTHITHLTTLEPRREGPISYLLRRGDEAPIEKADTGPVRPGIYTPSLTFAQAGDWRVAIRIGDVDVDLGTFEVHATRDQAHSHDHGGGGGISFLKEQQWKILSQSEPVGKRTLVHRLRVPGVVTPRPGGRSALTAPVEGRLLAPPGGAKLPTVGDRVEAGQVLALVQPPLSDFSARIVEAEAEIVRTQVTLEQSEATAARLRRLVADKARPERELLDAEFALRTARTNHEAAKSLRAAYAKSGAVLTAGDLPAFELRSPIAGVVTRVTAAAGENVHTESPVFTILDASRVWVEARISESHLGRLAGSRAAVFETPDMPGRFLPAGDAPSILSPEVDPATRTAAVIYDVANDAGLLRIGMSLTLHVETARVEEGIAVPESAIVDEAGRFVAFVQVSGETFEKRDLTLGIRDAGHVQVISGLQEGERVVTKGAYAVRLASVSTSIPAHGHAH